MRDVGGPGIAGGDPLLEDHGQQGEDHRGAPLGEGASAWPASKPTGSKPHGALGDGGVLGHHRQYCYGWKTSFPNCTANGIFTWILNCYLFKMSLYQSAPSLKIVRQIITKIAVQFGKIRYKASVKKDSFLLLTF